MIIAAYTLYQVYQRYDGPVVSQPCMFTMTDRHDTSFFFYFIAFEHLIQQLPAAAMQKALCASQCAPAGANRAFVHASVKQRDLHTQHTAIPNLPLLAHFES